MQRSPSRRRRSARRLTGMATAALITAGLVSLAPTAQGQGQPIPAASQDATIHRSGGKAIGEAGDTLADSVKAFLKTHGRNAATTGSLRTVGPVWKTRGVSHLRMDQHVAGLRVHDTYAKAAFNGNGQLIDLIENIAKVTGAPAKASGGPEAALRATVTSLYPNRSVDSNVTGRSGNTTSYVRNGFYAEPTVEQVAVPTEDGGMAGGYVVQTWTADDNMLHETLVSGDGVVVESELRTAEDSYSVFKVDPEAGDQVSRPGAAVGSDASPAGWLSSVPQFTQDITGNNAHTYLDVDSNNQPDADGTPVTGGNFLTLFDATASPEATQNRNVAAQNLFYLNNLIHDTLYTAGFTEVVGNFQDSNFAEGGRGSDPVAAEAQDGGGTDNANFATPRDGQDPRMQMYLWTGFGTNTVSVADGPALGDYLAAGAEFGLATTEGGVTGLLAVANDGVAGNDGIATGTATDGCETMPQGSLFGKIAIVDRGFCTFVVKAKNLEAAGAVAIVVANNQAGQPFTMGPADPALNLTAVMVDQTNGASLKTGAGGTATVRLTNPAPLFRDGDLDSDIVWHEYGHGLTWRMIGKMSGPMSGAIGEGVSDVLSVIVNNDPVVGEYSASDPNGIRTHSYEGYDRSYADIEGQEVHLDGEVYGAIGWDLWKSYQTAGLGQDDILADLVDGMNYTPAQPTFEEMRDGILAGLAITNPTRSCKVWNSFAKFGVGQGARGTVKGGKVSITESGAVPAACGTTSAP